MLENFNSNDKFDQMTFSERKNDELEQSSFDDTQSLDSSDGKSKILS